MRLKFLLMLFLAVVLSGCAEKEAADPRRVVEVSIFQGGFGIDLHQKMADEYMALHPDVKIDLWGDARNVEKIRPRLIAGNPPDLIFANIPIFVLIDEGQTYPLDDALNTPAYGQPGVKWKDTFLPGMLDYYKKDGHYCAAPFEYGVMGLWYNTDMFKRYGWSVPETWDELLSLCEKAKGKGIDPIAFQGRYPRYISYTLEDLIQRIGGAEAWLGVQNLKEGAWDSPAVVRAIGMVQDLRRKGYIPDSYMGLSHTEAQMKFVQGKAAMIPCGSWLENEMKSNTPPGFHMAFMKVPMPKDGIGDPTEITITTAVYFVTASGKNPALAADYLKFMTSRKNAERFVKEKKSLVSIECDAELSPALTGAEAAMKQANTVCCSDMKIRYPTFFIFYNEAMTRILQLEGSPEEIAAYLEKAAAQVRNDSRVRKRDVADPRVVR